mgnify:CR=1 FL=1
MPQCFVRVTSEEVRVKGTEKWLLSTLRRRTRNLFTLQPRSQRTWRRVSIELICFVSWMVWVCLKSLMRMSWMWMGMEWRRSRESVKDCLEFPMSVDRTFPNSLRLRGCEEGSHSEDSVRDKE